jgi:Zn-dependent protease
VLLFRARAGGAPRRAVWARSEGVVGQTEIVNIFAQLVWVLVPMLLSLTIHEYAHGLSASLLGDDTAKLLGRLTLNPIAHIDVIGTLLLPISLVVMSSGGGIPFFFGWAKPVPFNPLKFNRRISLYRGIMLTAAAGPLANLALALLCAGALSTAYHLRVGNLVPAPLGRLLVTMIILNINLCLFNLIPVYPLDGQKVVAGLLGNELGARFDFFTRRFGVVFLILVIAFGGRLIAGPSVHFFLYLVNTVLDVPLDFIQALLTP